MGGRIAVLALSALAVLTIAAPVAARDFGSVYADDQVYRVFGNSANVPDGTTLVQLRTVLTTAVVDGCADVGITVPRGMVFLPVLQQGQ